MLCPVARPKAFNGLVVFILVYLTESNENPNKKAGICLCSSWCGV